MDIKVLSNSSLLAAAAASQAARGIRSAIATDGKARIIAASAASQIEFLAALVASPGIDWTRVELFHLDEYIGLPQTHPATFRRFLEEHLVSKTGIAHCHWLTEESVDAISAAVSSQPIDIAFLGIGENAHLAFNDPPADFDAEQPYIRVALDKACRNQQVHEGWFSALPQVPTEAISMSIKQILKSRELVVVVPGPRKAEAVRASFEGGITHLVPASILRGHPNAIVYLDEQSAALLTTKPAEPGNSPQSFLRNKVEEL